MPVCGRAAILAESPSCDRAAVRRDIAPAFRQRAHALGIGIIHCIHVPSVHLSRHDHARLSRAQRKTAVFTVFLRPTMVRDQLSIVKHRDDCLDARLT
jgi:hypothetical protein